MKKFIIFLFLFGFGFGAYCGTQTVTLSPTSAYYDGDPDFIATQSLSLPVGQYSIKIVSVGAVLYPTAYVRCIEFNNHNVEGTLFIDRHSWDYASGTGNVTINTATSFVSWGWNWGNVAAGNVVLEITGDNITDPIDPKNDPNDPAYDPTDPGSDPDDDGEPNSTDTDDDGDGTPDVSDPEPYNPNVPYDPNDMPIPDPTMPDPTTPEPDTPVPDPDTPMPSPDPADPNDMIDNDDDVPAIQHFQTELLKDLEFYELKQQLRDIKLFNQLSGMIEVYLEMSGVWLNFVDSVEPNVSSIKTSTASIDSKLDTINASMTNLADLLTVIQTNNGSNTLELENIKGILEDSLQVQQDQLVTQNTILEVLQQIANPTPEVVPGMPDDPSDPVTPDYAMDFTFSKEANSTDLQKIEKTFPMFDTAFRERQGTVDYKLLVPLNEVSSRFEPMYINFSQGALGTIVAGFRIVFSSILFYVTLLYWFKVIRRITD